MRDTVIQIDNLWKKYRLGTVGTGTLAHDLNRWWHRIRGKTDPYLKIGASNKSATAGSEVTNQNPFTLKAGNVSTPVELSNDEFWALRGIALEVKQGEILGVIGRNGAGKSTLLKILSRVTTPTRGEVRIKGRVASLLEVGTGFHPELTGRENIFLNGAILGMSKAEIRGKLDEIVAFAEVEQFLDTPVKRYSSGMYVRLAFAVAAHLDPEILIVDEVLAVGDVQFQKKCLGKMGEVSSGSGKTVIFVSHNMDSVLRLCSRVLLLTGGYAFAGSGDPKKTISQYQNIVRSDSITVNMSDRKRDISLRRFIEIKSVEDCSIQSNPWQWEYGREIRISIDFVVRSVVEFWELGIGLFSADGGEVASWQNRRIESRDFSVPGTYRSEVSYKDLKLVPGSYFFGIGIRSNFGMEDYLPETVHFQVLSNATSAESGVDGFRGRVVPRVSLSCNQIS